MVPSHLLQKDAPALAGILRKLFLPPVAERLFQQYEQLVTAGGQIEKDITREEGVSFNPRPARVASIVINDGMLPDEESIALAFWACLDQDTPPTYPCSAGFLHELEYVQKGVLVEGVNETRINTVICALRLDEVRHLHMGPLSEQSRIERLDRAAELFIDARRRGVAEHLSKKLEHAVHQQRRMVRSDREIGSKE